MNICHIEIGGVSISMSVHKHIKLIIMYRMFVMYSKSKEWTSDLIIYSLVQFATSAKQDGKIKTKAGSVQRGVT